MAKQQTIRVGAAGIIIQDDKILLVKFNDENGPHYNYPGGGHHEGETLRQTAAREVKEETDGEVEVGRLLVIRESAPFEVDYVYGSTPYLKLFFECHLKPGSTPRLPDKPDPNEIAVEWVPVNDLSSYPVIPDISEELFHVLNGGVQEYFEDDGEAAKLLKEKQ